MIRNNIQEETKINSIFLPLSRAENSYTSTAIDSLNSGQPRAEAGMAVLHIGDDTGGASGLTGSFKLQDSADNVTFNDVAGASYTISGLPAASGVVAEVKFSPAAIRRYRQWVLALDFTAGSSPAVPCSAIEILGGFQQVPN
jgi:hypothetical protein